MGLRFGLSYVITYISAYVTTYIITYIVVAYIVTYVITYPYAWTVNFEMRFEMQLRTYQPPIPNTSQTSAWSYKYNGRWMGKTESSPTGLRKNFGRLNCWKKNLSKSIRFRTSGNTFWSWSTGSWFGSLSNSLQMEIHWFSIGFIDILKYWINHEFTKPLFL